MKSFRQALIEALDGDISGFDSRPEIETPPAIEIEIFFGELHTLGRGEDGVASSEERG